MAGDWFPMRIDLEDDPDVIAIADETGLPTDHVVGKLHRLWAWANKHLSDGRILVRSASASCPPDVQGLSLVDRRVGAEGFAAAMVSVGWLEVRDGIVAIPNWDTWNSKSAKRRLLDTRRKQENRSANCPHDERTKTGLQKRREENIKGKSKLNTKSLLGAKSPRTQKRFVPPTVEEVTAYCRDRENGIDPEAWMAHYTANGWRVGRNPMQDWRAAVRTWEQNRPKPESSVRARILTREELRSLTD